MKPVAEANQASRKERSPSLIINSIDFDKSIDVGNALGSSNKPIKFFIKYFLKIYCFKLELLFSKKNMPMKMKQREQKGM